MYRKLTFIVSILALSLLIAVPAFAGQPESVGGGLGNKAPDFSAGVYADGETWGTKGTTTLPAPTAANQQSFDKIFVVTNGADGQLPVGEAAPGNRIYNGGRWWAHTATWIEDLPHPKPVLTSYEDVMFHAELGHLVIEDARAYFQCPLLPVKE
jgi:hypothetical protein